MQSSWGSPHGRGHAGRVLARQRLPARSPLLCRLASTCLHCILALQHFVPFLRSSVCRALSTFSMERGIVNRERASKSYRVLVRVWGGQQACASASASQCSFMHIPVQLLCAAARRALLLPANACISVFSMALLSPSGDLT